MENSTLGKLSAELRDEVYSLVLTCDSPLVICSYEYPHKTQTKPTAIQPPITRVCKQSRSESLQLFYHLNTFAISIFDAQHMGLDTRASFFHGTSNVSRWMRCTDGRNHQAIEKLELKIHGKWGMYWDPSNWSTFMEIFERYGYRMPKLQTSVRITCSLRADEMSMDAPMLTNFTQRQEQKAKDFFSTMGWEVKTTFEFA